MKTVRVMFADDNSAVKFKNEMRQRFNFPPASKYQVVSGTDDNGASVFVENKLVKKFFQNFMENVKTKPKKISEADVTRSFEFHGDGYTDYEGMGFDAYYAGVSYFDCPIKHPEWAYYEWKDGWKKAEKQNMLH